ncbi:MAG: hypothetical protein H0V44_05055 [Planctomycetes bacterium]|nr:hypothetical protein [Planctomycetota bacterium]
MPSISDLLKSKIAAEGLSLAKAAAKVGVSVPSMRSAVAGSAAPNARSIGKYASFLGIGKNEAIAMVAASKGRGAKGTKKKPGKRGRPPGKRGRPAGKRRGRPPGKRGRPAKAAGRRGRPPGKRGRPPGAKSRGRGRPPGKRGRPAASGVSSRKVGAALKRVSTSIQRAEKYLMKVLKSLK